MQFNSILGSCNTTENIAIEPIVLSDNENAWFRLGME